MALDGIYLYSIIQELKNKIMNCKIDKINQPEKDEIVLTIRGNKNYKLLLSASSTCPKVHFTDINKPNPIKAPMFCMVLRKYLSNAKIVNISQVSTDRILIIDFESTDEFGFNSIYTLITEIMGRHSNITLVRQRDNIVIDSIKHITPDINSYRSLYPGIIYVSPPESTKLNPFEFSNEEIKDFVSNNEVKFDNHFYSNVFTGVSLTLSEELLYRINANNIEFNINFIDKIICQFIIVFNEIKSNNFSFVSYENGKKIKDFYCMKLLHFSNLTEKAYDSPSNLLQEFYLIKDTLDRLNARSSDLQRITNTNIDRCTKKLNILTETLKECGSKEDYRIKGELLTANIYNIKKGDKEIDALNYYSEDMSTIKIKLNENKTPSDNIQIYFKKYNKLKKSEEMAKIQIETTENELNYLQSVLTNINNAESYEEIEDIRRELLETGYIRFKKNDKQKVKATKPLHFVSSDGIDIYVGKNNFQNDYLTLKFADKHDIWMHTKNIPGSHVIIKKYGEIPEKTLLEAANLAAFYSKAKESSKVPVDYTEVKNVRKPSGSKPGMVIYYTNKTIFVTPENIELNKVKS